MGIINKIYSEKKTIPSSKMYSDHFTIERTENINLSNGVSLILFIFFILIVFSHRKNIFNLKNKTEQKIRI